MEKLLGKYNLMHVYSEYLLLFGTHPDSGSRSLQQMFSQVNYLMSKLGFPVTDGDQKWDKSNTESEVFRLAGNNDFAKENYMEALELYTRAVGKACENSAEIALAYGNRSAVTFRFCEYGDSLIDVGRAIDGNYPTSMIHKLYERKGDCLMALDDVNSATCAYESALRFLAFSKQEKSKILQIRNRIGEKLKNAGTPKKIKKADQTAPSHILKLTHPQSSTIECASNAVRIDYSEEMGRMVMANVDLKPGDTIAIEKPSAFILYEKAYTLFCNYCLERCHSSVPCTSCDRVFFCNEACRDRAWKRSHKIECALIPKMISRGCDVVEIFGVRLLFLMTDQGENLHKKYTYFTSLENHKQTADKRSRGFLNGKYPSAKLKTAYFLETNERKRGNAADLKLFSIALSAACVVNILKESPFFDSVTKVSKQDELAMIVTIVGGMLLNFELIVSNNAHALTEMRVTKIRDKNNASLHEIGTGLFNFISLFNHSCEASIQRTSLPYGKMAVTVSKFIKKGDQLFDCYVHHYCSNEIASRQRILQSQYLFVCGCEPCEKKWPLCDSSTMEDYLPGVDRTTFIPHLINLQEIRCKIDSGDPDQISSIRRIMEVIDKICTKPSKCYLLCLSMINECLGYSGKVYRYNYLK